MEKPLAAALLVKITNTTLHLGDWVGLWWFADWLIKPRGLSALTGRLLIWRGVWTRISAFHRLAGTSRPANHVTAGQCCRRDEGWGRRACVFSSCYVHVSPDLFLLSFLHSFFWCCLWFPCHPGLLVPTMHDRERQLIISLLLTAFTLHTVCQ